MKGFRWNRGTKIPFARVGVLGKAARLLQKMIGAENCVVRSLPKMYPGGELDSAFAWERGWKAVSCRRRIGNLVRMAETAQHSLAKAGLELVPDGWSRQQIFNSDGNG